MKIINLILMTIMMNGGMVLFDFNTEETSGKWYVVNDDVMGGISESLIKLNDNGTATFSGNLSLENNGGFASVRSPIGINLENNFKGVVIRLKGDGNIYSIRFRTNSNFDGYAYQAKIQTNNNNWEEYSISFKDFKPTFRGYELSNKPDLESKNIVQLSILIADKQFGDFSVDIDWIKFYD
jgi:hypothetical protein